MKRALIVALAALVMALALGATAQTTATAETPVTALPTNPPTCTAKALGVSRASNPGLAADCDTLLAIQSTLRVSGWIDYDTPSWWDHSYALNWSAHTPLRHWRAVTLGGTPQRVIGLDFSDTRESVRVFNARTQQWEASQPFTREWTLRGVIPTQLGKLARLRTLDLSNNKLTGELPTELDDLESLGRVRLAGNGFTGCAPAELWRITSHDLVTLGLPNCKPPLTYGAPSWTGIVDAPGEHAFFTNSGPAITYEGLRNDVVQVVIHKQDAGGVSRDAIYDDVEAGDDFEWREASDCWVRYLVERVMPDPTDMPLKVLAVKRYGYAYTGCSGTVSLTGNRTLTWIPPNIQSPDITVPVRHGIWLLLPQAYWNRSDWDGVDGVYEERVPLSGSLQATGANQPEVSTDLTAVQQHSLWRTPDLPAGWRLSWGMVGYDGLDGYQAIYRNERGGIGAEIYVYRPRVQPKEIHVTSIKTSSIAETRIINDRQAIVKYSPSGSTAQETTVWLFDDTAGISYVVVGLDGALRGMPDGIINVTRSLFGGENR